MKKVVFQGERGAFSEDAALKFFDRAETRPCHSLVDVFQSVIEERSDYGVVPVENSQAGSINETYDLLLRYDLNIVGEVDLAVNHCLLAPPEETLESVRTVYSHPQALAQCAEFLRRLAAEIVPTYDTAGSAKLIKEKGLRNCGAVASKRVSEIYGMAVLAEDIQTVRGNYTKFIALSRDTAASSGSDKTSLVFAVENAPGSLFKCLGAFATRDINLTKLESRPSKGKPWEYVFYVDFEGHKLDASCSEALRELQQHTRFVKILGSYPRTRRIE